MTRHDGENSNVCDQASAYSVLREAIGKTLPIRDRVEAKRQFDALVAENERLHTLIEQAAAEANHGELTDGTLASMTEVSEGA